MIPIIKYINAWLALKGTGAKESVVAVPLISTNLLHFPKNVGFNHKINSILLHFRS